MGKKSRAKKERKQEKLVVFICTANVCRSPMAEKLFEEAVAKSGTKKKIRAFSAGISAMVGDQASENSIIASSEVGLDLSDHRSSALTRAMIENASVIFCMTESHRALLNMYFEVPQSSPIFHARIRIGSSMELPDPFGQDIEVCRTCRDHMKEALPSLLEWVEKTSEPFISSQIMLNPEPSLSQSNLTLDRRPLSELDPAIFAVIEEKVRQRSHLELIASENFTLPAVIEATGSVLTNKYAEGYPAKRYYGGCEHADVPKAWPSNEPTFQLNTQTLSHSGKPTPRSISPCSNPATRSSR